MSMRPLLEVAERCRSCGSSDLTELIAFGDTPIADRLVQPGDTEPELTAPLTLVFCEACSLCQIRETLDPEVVFPADYPYYSSVSPALVAHFRSSALRLIAERGLGRGHRVVEAASNDGYMLEVFRDHGIDVLGIDPADGPINVARQKGIATIHDFFTVDLARQLALQGHRADLFLANNVLAHVADTNGFVAGIETLLAPDGIAVIEVPYLLDLVDHGAFDTIYHQHLLYLSLTALLPLFERHGLCLHDAERIRVHGGSIRLFVSRHPGRSRRLQHLLDAESRRRVGDFSFFEPFLARLSRMRADTRAAIADAISSGQRVAAYGAAAKGTSLLHYFGLGGREIGYVIDKSAWKQGLEMPGTRIPIVAPETLVSDRPDALLILAWNFANEIISENQDYIAQGGRFFIPVPEFRVVTNELVGVSL